MKLVLFDFDGVLVNTNDLCYQIHKIKNKDLSWATYQGYLSGNFFEKMDKAVKSGTHVLPDDYHGEYSKGLKDITIEEALHKLVLSLVKKYQLAIVSSTYGWHIESFVKKENLADYFSDILGADVHLSKIFKIKSILKKYGLSSREVVFITDTTGDIIEARECGVECIGVTWGFHDKEMLVGEKPFAVVDTPEELEGKIEEFFE